MQDCNALWAEVHEHCVRFGSQQRALYFVSNRVQGGQHESQADAQMITQAQHDLSHAGQPYTRRDAPSIASC